MRMALMGKLAWFLLHVFCGLATMGCVSSQYPVKDGHIAAVSEKSVKSQTDAFEGTTLTLHWEYRVLKNNGSTLVNTVIYERQNIYTNSSDKIAEAWPGRGEPLKRSSSLPDDLKSRLLAVDGKLMLNNLQYNDSSYIYKAVVLFTLNSTMYQTTLVPALHLRVIGIPKLLSDPPRQISVSENSVINVKHLLAGGQWLSLVVEWQFREYAHLHIPVSKMVYPAVYIAEHQTKKVDRTFCGKKLRVKAWSRHGTSKWKETIVNVKFTPRKPQNLLVTRRGKCIIVTWNKEDTGLCSLKYMLRFKTRDEKLVHSVNSWRKLEYKACNEDFIDQVSMVEVGADGATGQTATFKDIKPGKRIGNGAVGKMNICVAEVAIIIFSSFLINIQKR